MALSLIDVGTTANDGTGDPLRTAFQTVNTAITAVNNAVVVGTGTTTFKDDSGTYGVAVASNGNVTFTNAGATVGMTWDASAVSNVGGLGIGTTTPSYALDVRTASGNADIQVRASAGNHAYLRVRANNASNSLNIYALSGGDTYILNDTNGGTAYFSGRDTGNNVRAYLSGKEGVTSLFGNGTLAAKVSIGGDFTWRNAGATTGMTWDASANSNAGGLGIGTTTPAYELEVYAATGNADIQVKSSAGNHAYLRLVANGGSNALQLYALSGGASYLLNDTNGGTAYFSGRDTGNNVRTYLSGNEGVTSLFGNGTLAAKVSIGGDFTWQNAGATAGMTWDASALTNAGAVGVGTTTPTEQLDLSGDAIRIRTAQTPASAAATGDAGIICWDASYIYVCTATNTWKRVAISTW